jgi:hypothetical protein
MVRGFGSNHNPMKEYPGEFPEGGSAFFRVPERVLVLIEKARGVV